MLTMHNQLAIDLSFASRLQPQCKRPSSFEQPF